MKSLHKVLNVIDTVALLGNVGIRDLSSTTGFPPATTHRIVTTLVERGYFKQDPVTKTYSLSLKFLELGTRVQQHFNLTDVAWPHLERLMARTKENINLAVQDGDEAVYLDHVQSDYSMLQLFTKPGARVPLYATGVGKMFMSQWSDSELDAYLDRSRRKSFTPHTLVGRDELLLEIEWIRTRGYSVDNEEMEEGVRCVASLVFNHSRQPVAAVSISGAAMRITPDRIGGFGQAVKTCTLTISRELGYASPTRLSQDEYQR
jgi:DNA-binding IclR family transcriptional regulator